MTWSEAGALWPAPALATDPLASRLRRQIQAAGPLPFSAFMQAALYEPDLGYYARLRGFGPEGDFITSPEVHPAFGYLLGCQALELWERLERPSPLRVLELGGGSGALARSLLLALEQGGVPAEYWLDEISPSLRAAQAHTLQGQPVRWGRPADAHLLLANEVLDALPFDRVVRRDGALRELRVGLAESGAFTWVETPDASSEILAYFRDLGVELADGAVAEVRTGLAAWTAEALAPLRRGLALLVDYGAPAADLFRKPSGTLLTYFRHTMGSDPLIRVGQQDISAHVDFSTVATAAHRAGRRVLGLAPQSRALRALGLAEVGARLPGPTNQRALGELVDPRGLGAVQVLFLTHGLGDWLPKGLAGGLVPPLPGNPPALPEEPAPEAFMELWREAFGDGSEAADAID